jgi:5'(3')-deoxyribonucleotidase
MDDKPIVVLDCDGVLVEHSGGHLTKVNAKFGTSYQFSDITDWNYSFLSKPQRDYLYSCWHSSTLYDEDVLTPEQTDTIEGLREIARVVVCTSPMKGHVASKYSFLLRYFKSKDIIIMSDKSLMRGNVLVDDGPHNILAFEGPTVVYDQPWNQGVHSDYRVRDFTDIGPVVTSILMDQGYAVI